MHAKTLGPELDKDLLVAGLVGGGRISLPGLFSDQDQDITFVQRAIEERMGFGKRTAFASWYNAVLHGSGSKSGRGFVGQEAALRLPTKATSGDHATQQRRT